MQQQHLQQLERAAEAEDNSMKPGRPINASALQPREHAEEPQAEGLPRFEGARRKDHVAKTARWNGRKKKWKAFIFLTPLVPAIVEDVLANLPDVDTAATKEIISALAGISIGTRGSRADDTFRHAGGRSGYLARRMTHRSYSIGSALLPDASMELCRSLLALPRVKLASIGGAAGSDGLGYALLSYFLGHGGVERPNVVDTTVFEYEPGWEASARALHAAMVARKTNDVKEARFSLNEADYFVEGTEFGWGHMDFAPCDIRSSLSTGSGVNAQLSDSAPGTDLFVSNYVVVENKQEMLGNEFLMYRELFARAKVGAAFLFLDSSDLLWPPLQAAARRVEEGQARHEGEVSWRWDVIDPLFKNAIIFWKRWCKVSQPPADQ